MTMDGSKSESGKNGATQQECAGCGKAITERYLLKALDMYWHEDCLKCGCCDCRLGEVGSTLYTKANLIRTRCVAATAATQIFSRLDPLYLPRAPALQEKLEICVDDFHHFPIIALPTLRNIRERYETDSKESSLPLLHGRSMEHRYRDIFSIIRGTEYTRNSRYFTKHIYDKYLFVGFIFMIGIVRNVEWIPK